MSWGVPNSGFRLFGQLWIVLWTIRPNNNKIRIALPAKHFDAAPAVLIFTTSLCPSLITAVSACCLAMTLSPSFVSHNQAIWARAAGNDWVKSAVDMYRLTIHICSDDTICLNTNTLFGPLFSTEANTKQIFGTSMVCLTFIVKCFVTLSVICLALAKAWSWP